MPGMVKTVALTRAGGRSKIQPRQEEGCQVGEGWGGGGGAEALKVYVSPKIYPGNCLGCLLGSAGHALHDTSNSCSPSTRPRRLTLMGGGGRSVVFSSIIIHNRWSEIDYICYEIITVVYSVAAAGRPAAVKNCRFCADRANMPGRLSREVRLALLYLAADRRKYVPVFDRHGKLIFN